MTEFAVDIVVPVWNSPVETRSCLVNLAEHSPQARLIFVDNGSDRETERLLQEFAEILDRRALLVRTDANLGFVRAANRGLARGEAACLAVVRPSSIVSAGWLEPLLSLVREKEDAGVIVPRLVVEPFGRRATPAGTPVEVDHGAFAAIVVRKELYERVGGFDEGMDAGVWCLKDYSRRAWRAGFRSFAAPGGAVLFREETPLGAAPRREETIRRSMEIYRQRWGGNRSFCLFVPKGSDAASFLPQREVLLEGARHGHFFTVFLPRLLHEELRGTNGRHENLRTIPLPWLMPHRWLCRKISLLLEKTPDTVFVCGEGGFPSVGDAIPFGELEKLVADSHGAYYGSQDRPL